MIAIAILLYLLPNVNATGTVASCSYGGGAWYNGFIDSRSESSMSACVDWCAADSNCVYAIYYGGSTCYKKDITANWNPSVSNFVNVEMSCMASTASCPHLSPLSEATLNGTLIAVYDHPTVIR